MMLVGLTLLAAHGLVDAVFAPGTRAELKKIAFEFLGNCGQDLFNFYGKPDVQFCLYENGPWASGTGIYKYAQYNIPVPTGQGTGTFGVIGSWHVSRVSNMESVFYGAKAFDQPLDAWDVSRVTNMNPCSTARKLLTNR
jgi:surface protein